MKGQPGITRPAACRGALVLGVLLVGARTAVAQNVLDDLLGGPQKPSTPRVRISTLWSASGVEPGQQIKLAVVLDIQQGWHVQTNKPTREFLFATQVGFEGLPQGVVAGDVKWPEEHRLKFDVGEGPEDIPFYVGKAPIFHTVSVPADLGPGEHPFTVIVDWQACDDKTCENPEKTRVPAVLRVVAHGTAIQPLNEEDFKSYSAVRAARTIDFDTFGWTIRIPESSLLLLLLVAALGGFLLNLTPCVLPIIPIKVMGLARAAGNRSRCFLLGAVMSLGVIGFWLGLGGAIAFVADFKATNQLFQMPWFTITVGGVIALMALGMMGLFSVRLPQAVYAINPSQESLHGSFLFGVMTAVLSTPCTAPFMGAAAAWAATQAPAITLAVFAAIGAGMASPYLVLAAFPGLVQRMPRAGPAGELVKHVMGLLLLAAAAYFLGTGIAGQSVTPPDPPTLAYWWAVGILVAAAGAWLAVRTFAITAAPAKRGIFGAIGALLAIAGISLALRFTDRGPIRWIYYTPERLAEARAQGKVVVLEFTAQWCLNCHALEQAVLHDEQVVALLNSERVAPVKVDITGKNEPGNARLRETGRLTIPLLVVLDPAGKEVFKSDAYTVQQVVGAIEEAGKASRGRP